MNNKLNIEQHKLAQMLADGKTIKQIAKELNKNLGYFYREFEIIRNLIEASTNTHIVAMGIRQGWLD